MFILRLVSLGLFFFNTSPSFAQAHCLEQVAQDFRQHLSDEEGAKTIAFALTIYHTNGTVSFLKKASEYHTGGGIFRSFQSDPITLITYGTGESRKEEQLIIVLSEQGTLSLLTLDSRLIHVFHIDVCGNKELFGGNKKATFGLSYIPQYKPS